MRPFNAMLLRKQASGGGGSASAFNPSDKNASIILSNSNKTAATSATNTGVRAVQSRSSGVWQFEVVVTALGSSDSVYVGIAGATTGLNGGPGVTSGSGTAAAIGYRANGSLFVNGFASATASASYTTGDVVGVVVDFTSTSARYRFYKNGVLVYTASDSALATITGAVFPMVGNGGSNTTWQLTLNFPLSFPVSGATAWG